MEREDSLETNSIREQSFEDYGYEVWGTQTGNVRGFHLLGKLQGIFGQRAFQNTGRQKGTQLAENVLNGSDGRWIVRLDGYNMIIEHRKRDKHRNADNLSNKTDFQERQEQREADRPEIKDGFSV